MQRWQIRCIIIIAVLIAFAVLVLRVQYKHPVQKANIDISNIPLNIGGWHGAEIPVDQNTKDILETEAVLMREYSKDNNSIVLAIVYYKDSKVALHQPESCLSGQGSKLAEREEVTVAVPGQKSFPATQIVTTSDRGDLLILYYFETGNIRTNSYGALRWQMLINKLKSRSNSGALVRFSAPITKDQAETLKIIKEFITEIGPILPKYLI